MNTLIDLAKSALRSVSMAVELIGVGSEGRAEFGGAALKADHGASEVAACDQESFWYTDGPSEIAMRDERWTG
jgi:hypothetical protein